jgi:hypothetical protein
VSEAASPLMRAFNANSRQVYRNFMRLARM